MWLHNENRVVSFLNTPIFTQKIYTVQQLNKSRSHVILEIQYLLWNLFEIEMDSCPHWCGFYLRLFPIRVCSVYVFDMGQRAIENV